MAVNVKRVATLLAEGVEQQSADCLLLFSTRAARA